MGLKINRYFTKADHSVYDIFQFELRDSVEGIRKYNQQVQCEKTEVPLHWSTLASDIFIHKYSRKTDVPLLNGEKGGETSVRQVVHRMAKTWCSWGERYGYFHDEQDKQAFYDETVFMMLGQYAAPNSPQWFNTGLYECYGIKGESQGHYFTDPETAECKKADSAYSHPQAHACFILSVKDDLLGDDGIMNLLMREARVFKFGSGSGTNYSSLRSKYEKLSGGGYSSGLLSFLRLSDALAGAVRSGGATRRAAKMICIDADHPEIEEVLRWKSGEESKAQALMHAGYSSGMEGEAYETVSGQNSAISIRFTDSYFNSLRNDGKWGLFFRSEQKLFKEVEAHHLWSLLAASSWKCADPGVQFDTTINDWNTCAESGRIIASNPCAEFLFLNDTGCNLAALNLVKFLDDENLEFDVKGFQHACRIWTIVLEITVLMSEYPSPEVARNSYDFRPLGLGFTNLGTFLMSKGWAYDSDTARSAAAAIGAIMTATGYLTSAELAQAVGPFPLYEKNKTSMMRVIKNHKIALSGSPSDFTSLSKLPFRVDFDHCPAEWLKVADCTFAEAIALGEKYGFRNAQVTAIAPTGTISMLMDCDTTGIEPEFSLVKFKHLLGGKVVKMVNRHVPNSMINLGYSEDEVDTLMEHLIQNGSLEECQLLKRRHRFVFATMLSAKKDFRVDAIGQLKMVAAVQPFISGGISKTINLPESSTVAEVGDCFLNAWKYGLKAVSVYRQGCKSGQPITGTFFKTKKDRNGLYVGCGLHPDCEGEWR